MKYLFNILLFISSLMLITVGIDKFFPYLEPPCSLEHTISPLIWKILGLIQIVGGVLIWLPKYRKAIALFFIVFMLTFSVYHLTQQTYDIGGSLFMAVLFGLLIGIPKFIKK